jgi:predicted TPR repeat methyltransferase
LDLGCGYGWHCKNAAQMGATEILGIDSSQKMIAKAVADNSDDKIKYKVCGVEEYIYPENTYDLVVSNLVLHYIENLANVYQKVYCTLKVGGYFLFNIEHPTFTARSFLFWC